MAGRVRWWVAVVFVLGGALTALAVADYAHAGWTGGRWRVPAEAVTAMSWLTAGTVTAYARPRMPFGWLLAAGGLCLAASGALTAHASLAAIDGRVAEAAWTGWVGGWVFFPHLGAAAAVYLLFPAGDLPSPRWRVALPLVGAANVAAVLVTALTPGPLAADGPLASVANPIGGVAWAPSALPFAVAAINATFLSSVFAMRLRLRGIDARLRPTVRLVFWLAVVNTGIGLLLIEPPGPWIYGMAVPSTVCLTAAVSFGIVRGALWDVRATVGRALTFLALTGCVVAVFVGAVTASTILLGNDVTGVPIAALIVCIGLTPVQRRLRDWIERLLYGRRTEPYAVLSAFGTTLEAAGEPGEGLRHLTELAAASLRLPWVAVELRAAGTTPVASAGRPQGSVVRLALRHHGEDLGALVVGLRAGETEFAPADRRLLEDLARQAGAAAYASSLTAALRRHRADLVAVREQERRRLRRDLHDGVASTLTALGLKTEVAAELLPHRPERGAVLIAEVRADLATALSDIRRVIEDLGPAVVTDLGLRGALATLARRFSSDNMTVTADIAPGADRLDPSVEAAVYWIVNEALQNVAKHAQASRCEVTMTVAGTDVDLRIADDGRGVPPDATAGGGMPNMRLRAEEVGGSWSVGGPGVGTEVRATLPLAVPLTATEERLDD
ncbi:sensor histidine kinase [Sphaerimonospora thailandensis]|uniref:sensor histidine kinase n=1 Tax=Sphaerimonospora thailandensis TaxID=795644 RepID=UPI00194FA5E7|nr:sensor histidine kinase [Sphaerimonospora thailandensis]